jgi:NTP pyrophosphatase (non-canonical NTP hydrolase)
MDMKLLEREVKVYRPYIECMMSTVHEANHKWWVGLEDGRPLERNVGEMLMLMVSEIAEGMEGHRKNLMDDKLPNRPMLEVEMADLLIRLLDFCGGHKLDLAGAFADKMIYNATRADHTHEARKAAGGKAY